MPWKSNEAAREYYRNNAEARKKKNEVARERYKRAKTDPELKPLKGNRGNPAKRKELQHPRDGKGFTKRSSTANKSDLRDQRKKRKRKPA